MAFNVNPNWWHAQNMANGSGENDSEEVSLYRSYGVKKKVYPLWERIKLTFFQGLLLWLFIPWVLISIAAYSMFMAFYPEMWVKILFNIFLWGFLVLRVSRTLRKRRKFTKKFKKICKKKGFQVHYEQNFFQSLIWSPDKQDFVVEAKNTAYYVRYLTINKYRSTLYLENEHLLRLEKEKPKGLLRIFVATARTKKYPFDFQIPPRSDAKRIVKVLVINPVCAEIRTKSVNGGYETTGDSGTQFGFTVHTGSGFLNALEREE